MNERKVIVQLPYENQRLILDRLQETALFLWKEWSMDMTVVGHDSDGNFAFTGTCPHGACKRPSVFVRIQCTNLGSARLDPMRGNMLRWIAVMQCQGCKRYILGIAEAPQHSANYDYVLHYPVGAPDDTVADEIPDHIKPDFREALRCLSVDAYNATAEMCRRALEASCIHLGASPKDWLEDMIDELETKRIITPFQKEVAHKIRAGGNRGAHPGAPAAPSIITKEHAEAIVKFATEFFHHVYVVPKELDKYDFSKPKAVKS